MKGPNYEPSRAKPDLDGGKREVGAKGKARYGFVGWDVKKLANRKYEAKHVETARVFVIHGHPNIHKWWATETLGAGKDAKTRSIPITDTTSLRQMIEALDNYLGKLKALPPQPVASVMDPSIHFLRQRDKNFRTKPDVVIPLKVKRYGLNRSRWMAPDRQLFEVIHDAKGYHCHAVPNKFRDDEKPVKMTISQAIGSYPHKGLMVAIEMETEHEALLELLYFLEPADPSQTYSPEMPVYVKVKPLPNLDFRIQVFVGADNEVSEQVEAESWVDEKVEFEVNLWRGRGHKVYVEYDDKDPFHVRSPFKTRFML